MPLGAPITSRTNARVKALRAAFSGEARRPGDLVGIEGEHLIAEALRSGMELEAVFIREGSEAVLDRPSLAGLPTHNLVVLSPDVFASAVDTVSPQGIAATVAIPERPGPPMYLGAKGPFLVLESIQDPGNLGTLLRSAEAFDAPFVWMTPDSVNPWNPKVVRASAGSVFRVPLQRFEIVAMRKILQDIGAKMFAAVVHQPGAKSVMKTPLGEQCAIMIGNEGAGLSREAIAMADGLVTIPCEVESLNAAVAGSLLLYEAMRQRFVKEEFK
jgi:TrmH family RNA methyltransferase